jgi:hypothetical protein
MTQICLCVFVAESDRSTNIEQYIGTKLLFQPGQVPPQLEYYREQEALYNNGAQLN